MAVEPEQGPAVVLVGLAVVLALLAVGQAGALVHQSGGYEYRVDAVDPATVPDDVQIRAAADLSPTAKDIFDRARAADEAIRDDRRAPDLQYNDDDVPTDGYNYVRDDGRVYRLFATTAGTGLAIYGALGYLVLGGGPALILGALGAVSYRTDRVALPTAILAAIAGLAAGTAVFGVGVGLVLGTALLVATWLAIAGVPGHDGRRVRRS